MKTNKGYFHQGPGTLLRYVMPAAGVSYYTPAPGPGAVRQRERLQAKAERLGATPDGRWTRQRDRAEMRRIRKKMRAERKAHAAKHAKGGAATERSV